jgi:addiction module RelE/StbE family toxin
MMMVRIAKDKALPFDPLVPNDETNDATKVAQRGKVTSVAGSDKCRRPSQRTKPLPERHVDHALSGGWADFRDWRICPDMVVIYRKPDSDTLEPSAPGLPQRTLALKRSFVKTCYNAFVIACFLSLVIPRITACRNRSCRYALSDGWADFRDCHICPDMVLIYREPDSDTLQPVRRGSHSELGLLSVHS